MTLGYSHAKGRQGQALVVLELPISVDRLRACVGGPRSGLPQLHYSAKNDSDLGRPLLLNAMTSKSRGDRLVA